MVSKKELKLIKKINAFFTNNMREVQKLTNKLANFSRFISWTTNKCLTIFKNIMGNHKFEWNHACEKIIQELKTFLRNVRKTFLSTVWLLETP